MNRWLFRSPTPPLVSSSVAKVLQGFCVPSVMADEPITDAHFASMDSDGIYLLALTLDQAQDSYEDCGEPDIEFVRSHFQAGLPYHKGRIMVQLALCWREIHPPYIC